MRQSPFYASDLVLFRINPFELTELNPKLPVMWPGSMRFMDQM